MLILKLLDQLQVERAPAVRHRHNRYITDLRI
jgi:hypothetical protein